MVRTPQRDMHVHVFSKGNVEIERYRLFRDHLRANTKCRDEYARLKRDLIAQSQGDMEAYAGAKTDFVEHVIALARHAMNQK